LKYWQHVEKYNDFENHQVATLHLTEWVTSEASGTVCCILFINSHK
jgi:hypothetical protein